MLDLVIYCVKYEKYCKSMNNLLTMTYFAIGCTCRFYSVFYEPKNERMVNQSLENVSLNELHKNTTIKMELIYKMILIVNRVLS